VRPWQKLTTGNRPPATASPRYHTCVKKTVYLSLGSNLGDRQANLRNAIGRLLELGDVAEVSSLYETEPVEVIDQPWFLNCAVAVRTDLTPREFLAGILVMEKSMGRVRTQPKGPRVIDIDILLFGAQTINTPQLTVPHPAIAERRFVLEPLAEIAPDMVHPVLKKTVGELLRLLPQNGPKANKILGN
jgi:2-amino-4-hydroxy-6-hydroxymethyldihydropteridine diphosphokinase